MIGIIVTGHGSFATGMTSALKLIVGDVEGYESVDFDSLEGTDDLERDLTAALDALSGCDGTLVFCDLVGGSPFKTAVTLGVAREGVRVMAGTNLGTLIETYMTRDSAANVDELADRAVETAKKQVTLFQMAAPAQDESDEDGGI
ncbi:MAG: PTS sugar transporter subunit IIA [Atopobiaceae bacterium]|jgi:PTS system N-acetylgalactosamine-specific IIA component|nr:PTS sugar transporter subunit IIA [Atopobiaceae bacterium]MCI2172658.1 PTS sugar transporter subunit IIA [Atopobiaceae bacterium]MCI2206965.1 PTS sugar transporter subunit IIA [Atopobiaceae bacterium]